MSHVRLPLVCRDFLMSCVESETLIRDDSECKELLLEVVYLRNEIILIENTYIYYLGYEISFITRTKKFNEHTANK